MRGPATVLVCLALGCATAPERPAASATASEASAPDAGSAATTAAHGTPAAFGEVDALLAQALPAWGGGVLRVERDDAVIFERVYGVYTTADAVPIGVFTNTGSPAASASSAALAAITAVGCGTPSLASVR